MIQLIIPIVVNPIISRLQGIHIHPIIVGIIQLLDHRRAITVHRQNLFDRPIVLIQVIGGNTAWIRHLFQLARLAIIIKTECL